MEEPQQSQFTIGAGRAGLLVDEHTNLLRNVPPIEQREPRVVADAPRGFDHDLGSIDDEQPGRQREREPARQQIARCTRTDGQAGIAARGLPGMCGPCHEDDRGDRKKPSQGLVVAR